MRSRAVAWLIVAVAIGACMSPLGVDAFTVPPENPLRHPAAGEIWRIGGRHAIQWDPLYRLPDNLYYNNFTRLKLRLRRVKDDSLVMDLVDEYPFAYGSVYWTPLPAQLNASVPGVDQLEQHTTAPANPFYVQLYPTYFDWPDFLGCKNCMSRGAMKSAPFALVSDCANVTCAAEVEDTMDGNIKSISSQPTLDAAASDNYLSTVRSVGVGVGVTVLVGFVIVGLLYTKRTRRTWQAYRQRRSGVVYKPSVSTIKRPLSGGDPGTPGAGSTGAAGGPVFAVSDRASTAPTDQWSEMDTILDEEHAAGGGGKQAQFSSARPAHPTYETKLFPQHERMHTLPLSPLQNPPIIAAGGFQDFAQFLPPRPGTALTRSTGTDSPADITNSGNKAADAAVPPQLPPLSPIQPSDALIVGNTFRSALRVNNEDDDEQREHGQQGKEAPRDIPPSVTSGDGSLHVADSSFATASVDQSTHPTESSYVDISTSDEDATGYTDGDGEYEYDIGEDSTPRRTGPTFPSASAPALTAAGGTAAILHALNNHQNKNNNRAPITHTGFDAPTLPTGNPPAIQPLKVTPMEDMYGISPVLSGMRWLDDAATAAANSSTDHDDESDTAPAST